MLRVSNETPSTAYPRLNQTGRSLKETAKRIAVRLNSGVSAEGPTTLHILEALDALSEYRAYFNDIAALPGLDDFARVEEADQSYVITDELAAIVSALDAAIVAGQAAMPTDANGNETPFKRGADGKRVYSRAPRATLRNFRTSVQAVVSLID